MSIDEQPLAIPSPTIPNAIADSDQRFSRSRAMLLRDVAEDFSIPEFDFPIF